MQLRYKFPPGPELLILLPAPQPGGGLHVVPLVLLGVEEGLLAQLALQQKLKFAPNKSVDLLPTVHYSVDMSEDRVGALLRGNHFPRLPFSDTPLRSAMQTSHPDFPSIIFS